MAKPHRPKCPAVHQEQPIGKPPPQKAMPLFALFFTCGLVAYALNIVLRHLAFWGWVPFVLPTAACCAQSGRWEDPGQKLHWLSCEASADARVGRFGGCHGIPARFCCAMALIYGANTCPPAVTEAFPGADDGAEPGGHLSGGPRHFHVDVCDLHILAKTGDSAVFVLMMGAVAATLALIRVMPLLAGDCADPLGGRCSSCSSR